MNKFEQLIEYVINDEQDKASELFHEIVVEKSRDIYENIMAEEEALDEEVVEEDDAVEESEETVEEGTEEELGGSEAGELIDDIETEEEGISMEAEEDGEMMDADSEEDLEDRVVDLEDKLDELMAEFEELMGDVDVDGDGDHDMDDHEAQEDGEEEAEEMEMMDSVYEGEALEEGADLTAAPKPVTSEEGDGKSGPVAANSGAKGMDAKPVHTDTTDEKGRPAPSAQDQGGTTEPDLKPAPKPVTK